MDASGATAKARFIPAPAGGGHKLYRGGARVTFQVCVTCRDWVLMFAYIMNTVLCIYENNYIRNNNQKSA